MSKLAEMMKQHPEMTPVEIVRVQIAKVPEPNMRAALLLVADLAAMPRDVRPAPVPPVSKR